MPAVTQQSVQLRNNVFAHRDEIHSLARKYGVKNVRIFGSVAQGVAHSNSDIDILVDDDGIHGLFAIADFHLSLQDILGVHVDVSFSNSIKEGMRSNILTGKQIWVC